MRDGQVNQTKYVSQTSSVAEDRIPIDYDGVFGNDSGEDEDPLVLADYFVEAPVFSKFFSPDRPLEIVSGRKGMGKSALLSYLGYRLREGTSAIDAGALVIKVTGNDLVGLADFSGTDQARLENRWKQAICKSRVSRGGRSTNAGWDGFADGVQAHRIKNITNLHKNHVDPAVARSSYW